jgi:hypothetical protein
MRCTKSSLVASGTRAADPGKFDTMILMLAGPHVNTSFLVCQSQTDERKPAGEHNGLDVHAGRCFFPEYQASISSPFTLFTVPESPSVSKTLPSRAFWPVATCGAWPCAESCQRCVRQRGSAIGAEPWLPRRAAHVSHATYDIPPGEGLADAVPHRMASRVVEWALGDQIDIAARGDNVRFDPSTSH